ncbi:MAG: hypothetical protein HQK55_17675 [Deltaproteobacteria bacterium]|nr:hypothetical protein [Deltaproteobacteria bacterium]
MIKPTCLSVAELEALRGNRDVYLWGASIVGWGICRALERRGIPLKAFLDSSPRFKGKQNLGYPVLPPDELLNDPEALKKAFVIISSGHYEDEIAGICRKHGLDPRQNFISARALSPLDPSVDVSGICNLKCISCPRGNMTKQPSPGFMSAATYTRVMEKLLREIPFLGNIQLYAWGEPLLHKELAEIIKGKEE